MAIAEQYPGTVRRPADPLKDDISILQQAGTEGHRIFLVELRHNDSDFCYSPRNSVVDAGTQCSGAVRLRVFENPEDEIRVLGEEATEGDPEERIQTIRRQNLAMVRQDRVVKCWGCQDDVVIARTALDLCIMAITEHRTIEPMMATNMRRSSERAKTAK